jgi:hypothetical protein
LHLSKSLYTRAIQCPKSLWLKKYKPEVLTLPDTSHEAIFETGNAVGDLACQLFPNGQEIPYNQNYDEMIAQTQALIEAGVPYIYEATFSYDGILVMVDILQVDETGVSIYEVKSSTGVKEIYLHDVAIQYYVLSRLGFRVNGSYVIHIDNSYVRGDVLEIEELFCKVDVTDEVMVMQEEIPITLERFDVCLRDRQREPEIDIGQHCKKPYACDAMEYCWQVQRGIPEYSIFNIFNLGSKKQMELYGRGIVQIEDIPDGFAMTANQRRAVEIHKNRATFIDKPAIDAFLDRLSYPIYHLDFETFQQAVPEFKGVSPYEQIPFQYSIHIEHEDGRLEHREFLAQEGSDPRYALAKSLVTDIPIGVTVLAYNMSFEKGVLRRLAGLCGEFADHLMQIHEQIEDLMLPFQKKWYVTHTMQGSYSIKYVLPALAPEMAEAYEKLDLIHNGAEAMHVFANLAQLPEKERTAHRRALLEYCKLDTLAMVKVLEALKQV